MIVKNCLAACLFILLPLELCLADQNDTRLDELFNTIRQTDSADVANKTVNNIWEIWLQNDDKQTQERLAQGIAAMDHDPHQALLIFDKLIIDVPEFAECWNKRATLYYLVGDYKASVRDIEKTLELEPRHFGALSGLGLVYLEQGKFVKAKAAFKAALQIHPHSRSIQYNMELVDNYILRNAV
jgi:tetratricopeptide (TPR) repeat protein